MTDTPPRERTPAPGAPHRDAPITVALLIAGLYNVTISVANARIMPTTLDETYAQLQIGHYTDVALATTLGYVVCAVQLVSLCLAIGLSVTRLRAGKRSFWIPLVIAVVCELITGILYAVAILSDPAFAAHFARLSG